MKSLDKRDAELAKKLETADIPKAVQTLIQGAEQQKKVSRRQRWQIIGLAVSVAFDLVLTVVILSLATQAENNKQAIIARCEQTNEQRVKGAHLWDYFIVQTENIPRTPDEQKFRDGFIDLKNETYALSDCTKAVK